MKTFFIKQRHNLRLLCIDYLVVLLAWGPYFRGGINADTMIHISDPAANINAWKYSGRYLGYLSSYILYHYFGFSAPDHFKVVFALFLFLLGLSLFFIQKTFEPVFKSRHLLTSLPAKVFFLAATCLPLVNLLFAEYFYFTECYLMFPQAYFCASLAVFFISRRRRGAGILFLILTPLFYQSASVFAVMLLAAWIILDEGPRFSVRLLLREFLWTAFAVGTAALDLMSTLILARLGLIAYAEKGTTGDYTGLSSYLAKQFAAFFRSSLSLMPPLYLPLIVTVIAVAALVLTFIKRKEAGAIPTLLLLLILDFGLTIMFPVLCGSDNFLPRLVHVLYTAQAMLLLLALCYASGTLAKLAGYTAAAYLFSQIFFLQIVIQERYVSNQLDKTYSAEILRCIEHYEEETGERVTKLAITTDDYAPDHYPEVHYASHQINERLLRMGTWQMFHVLWGRDDLVHVEMPEEIENTYFKGHDWDYFDPAVQLIIEGDTAYYCVF